MLRARPRPPRARVKILGVTVLTSLLEDDLRAEGIETTIPEMVRARARVAARAGIAGLVCSPHEIEHARAAAPGLFIVVPGIRPSEGAGAAHGDQKRVATAGAGDRKRRRLPGRRPPGARRRRSGQGVRGAGRRSRSRGVSERRSSSASARSRSCCARGRARCRWSTSPTAIARPRSIAWCGGARSRGRPRVPAAPDGGGAGGRRGPSGRGRADRRVRAMPSWARSCAAVASARRASRCCSAAGRHHRPAQLRRAGAQRRGAGRARRRRARSRRGAGDAGGGQVVGGRDRAHADRARRQSIEDHRLAARARRARARAPTPMAGSDWTRSTSRCRWRWWSAPRGRGCARRWRGGATPCFTFLSAARSLRSTRRSRAPSRSTKRRASDKSAECENSPSRSRHCPR